MPRRRRRQAPPTRGTQPRGRGGRARRGARAADRQRSRSESASPPQLRRAFADLSPESESDAEPNQDRRSPHKDDGIQATLQAINRRLAQLEEQRLPAPVPPAQPQPIAAAAGGPAQGQDVAPIPIQRQPDPIQLLTAQGAANNQGEPLHVQNLQNNRHILGHTLPDSIRNKIQDGAYVDLATLKKSTDPVEQPTITVQCSNSPQIQLVTTQPREPDSFGEWLRLFSIFSSVHVQYFPADAAPLFSYQAHIQHLSTREAPFVWRNYDREFRKLHAKNHNLPWEKLDYELLLSLQPARAPLNQPRKQQQPFHPASGGPPPEGACNSFYHKGFCKRNWDCPYKHLCGHCRRPGHNLRKCHQHAMEQARKQSTNTNKKPNP